MPQPKKGHVQYARRIPAAWVASMDAHLKQLRAGAWRKASMVVAFGDLDGKHVQVKTEPPAMVHIPRTPILKPGGKL